MIKHLEHLLGNTVAFILSHQTVLLMRTLYLFLCLFFNLSILFAQKGFELTVNTSLNFSFINNQNDIQESSTQSRLSFGNSSLITVGHHFNKNIGIATGLGFTYLRQNYVKTSTAKQIKILQETSHRALTYARLPLLISINTNPDQPIQFFMRFGPHLDALITATSKTEYPFNSGQADQKINYRGLSNNQEKPLKVFNDFTIGLSLDLGTKIRLSDRFSLLILAHVESSLSNIEGQDSPNYFPASFRAVTPKDYILVRQQTYGIMLGLNIGLSYSISSNSQFFKPRSRFRNRYWRAQ